MHQRVCGVFMAMTLGVSALMPTASAQSQLGVWLDGQNRVLGPGYYDGGFGPVEAMVQPGNVVLIDDWFHNSIVQYGQAQSGDSFGVRSTSPNGTVRTNAVTHGGSCWFSSGFQYCPASSSGWWEFGTSVRFGALGQWTIELLSNGAVVASTSFQLKPYTLDFSDGQGQALPPKSITPIALSVRLTRPDFLPAGAGKEVRFQLTGKPGGANPAGGLTASAVYTGSASSTLTVQTDGTGLAQAYLETGGKVGNYVVTVTAPTAPAVSKVFTVVAAGSDPLDAATREKNLGGDPANNSSCAAATSASTEFPIQIGTGNKFLEERDYESAGHFPLRLVRYYNSLGTRPGSLGARWRHFYDRRLIVTTTTARKTTTTVAEAIRADGRVLRFSLTNGSWVAEPDVVDRLQTLGIGYRLICGDDQSETYDAQGRLTTVATREGHIQTLTYDGAGRLAQVMDAGGRRLAFEYGANNRVARVTDPAGQRIEYSYDTAGRLVAITHADLSRRQYLYESGAWPLAVTGIVDETGQRYASYDYDAAGRAIASVLGGGVSPRRVIYHLNGQRDVVDGLGQTRRYGFSVIQGVARRVSMDNAACDSCGHAVMQTNYSATGYVSGVTDYRGIQTTFVRDARGLETSRTEAAGTALARTVATAWHAALRVPLSVTWQGQRLSLAYDGSGRIIGRTVTDTANGAARTWAYAYNTLGLVERIDGPRTDVADESLFTYDAAGNLATVRNALGHLTRFTRHDAHGRPLEIVDPNGVTTTLAYDLRGRLAARNVAGRLTTFTYLPTGELLQVTRPDGSWTRMQYDAARRLVGEVESAGHRRQFVLDVEGRRVVEEHVDAWGGRSHVRSFTHDPLGRVLTTSDAAGRRDQTYTYDAAGSLVVQTDALGGQTRIVYDVLGRPASHTDALNATTLFEYDTRDNLVRVIDPIGVATAYGYDGLDNRTLESSADTGTRVYAYDAAGNLRTLNWPNGRSVALSYDALGRLVQHRDGASTVLTTYAYDAGANGVGLLTSMSDAAGQSSWSHDPWGQVLVHARTTGSRTLVSRRAYDAGGRLASLTYPSGRVVSYAHDGSGRVAAITLDGTNLLSSISWQPFGVPKSWVQGNGRVVQRSFDLDGRMTVHSLEGGSRSMGYDAKGRLVQAYDWHMQRSFAYDAVDRLVSDARGAQSWSWGYDANGNRLTQTTPTGASTLSYQGNRLQAVTGQSARSFAYDAAGNITADGATPFAYDAANRLVQAAGETYGHDGTGLLVSKSGSASRYWMHDADRQVLGEYDDHSAVYEVVWLGTTPVAVVKSGLPYWIDADHLDTPRAISDASQVVTWRWASEAFGHSAADENPGGQGLFEFNLRFPGQVYDRDTGLHHNDQREYLPGLGRYSQADPIGLAGGVNTYAYALGNPVSLVDPDGLDATVCLYPGARTAGHVGIGINSSSTVGLYPRSESPGVAAITGTPGAIKPDAKLAEQCKTVSTSAEQDKKMADFIARATANPGTYRLGGNNCTNFVRSVLQQANISTAGFPGPRPFFEALSPGK